jgi:NAD(P)H dehydrogenase (quinone)
MYAVMGVTGQVGSAVAETLLAKGKKIRIVVRNAEKAAAWKERGAEIAVAEYSDAAALTEAFRGVEGVFGMIPPYFAPAPGFPEARGVIAAIKAAIVATKPKRAVYLSTIGAQLAERSGLLMSLHILEEEMSAIGVPSAFLRAGWFMENSLWDVPSAKSEGKIYSFLQPLDKHFSMVATADIGRVAGETLLQSWDGNRYIEVAGPTKYSPLDWEKGFTKALGREVQAVVVPQEDWQDAFVKQGMPADRTVYRIEMVAEFNSGWISFGVPGTEHATGTVELETVLRELVERA